MIMSGRASYRDELAKIAGSDPKILCLEADLGGSKHPFQKAFPERFMNIGISELAGIDIAGGLAANGFTPFFSTFASFAALRGAESLKLTLGYMGLNVKVVAPYAGVSGAWFGTSHHCLEDLAILQSFPGITIAAPYGEAETRAVIRHAAQTIGPFYIRMGRDDAYESLQPSDQDRSENHPGKILWHRQIENRNDTICLVSVGERPTHIACQAIALDQELAHAHLCYLDYTHISLAVTALQSRYRKILVIEEHRPAGGIASTLALMLPQNEIYAFNCGTKWSTTGGNYSEVLADLGFNLENLQNTIERIRK